MSWKDYGKFYEQLEALVGGDFKAWIKEENPLKLKAPGFMDLNIDFLYLTKTGFVMSMAHNYVQNGDVMSDPDMEIEVYLESKQAEPLTYQLSSMGLYQKVYEYDEEGTKTGVRPKVKQELRKFLKTWFKNIKVQGHKLPDAEPETREGDQTSLGSFE